MSRLVNWEWEKHLINDDIEDMFLPSKKKLDPPIESTEILTREDLLKLSVESDVQASKDTFNFQ